MDNLPYSTCCAFSSISPLYHLTRVKVVSVEKDSLWLLMKFTGILYLSIVEYPRGCERVSILSLADVGVRLGAQLIFEPGS